MLNERNLENSMLRPCVHDERYDEPSPREWEVEVKWILKCTFNVEAESLDEAEDIAWEMKENLRIDNMSYDDEEINVREV